MEDAVHAFEIEIFLGQVEACDVETGGVLLLQVPGRSSP